MIEEQLKAPIPGESLTEAPNKYAWERPPETVDPEKAIVHHIERLSQEKVQDNVLDALQMGLPVSYITDLALTGAVINGIHNIDVSLLIGPVIHEFVASIADASGLEYKEFFEEDKTKDTSAVKQKAREGLRKAVDMAKDKDEGVRYLEELEDAIPDAEPTSEIATPIKGKGLMAKEDII